MTLGARECEEATLLGVQTRRLVAALAIGVGCGLAAVRFEPAGGALLVIAALYCGFRTPREVAKLVGVTVLVSAMVFAPSAVVAATERLCILPIGPSLSASSAPCIPVGGPDLYRLVGLGLLMLSAGSLLTRGRRMTAG
jgi:hypothetical protein